MTDRAHTLTDAEHRIVAEALLIYAGALSSEAGSLQRRGHVSAALALETDRDDALRVRQRLLT